MVKQNFILICRIVLMLIFIVLLVCMYNDYSYNYRKYDMHTVSIDNKVKYSDFMYDERIYCTSNYDIINNHSDSKISFINPYDYGVSYNLGIRVDVSSTVDVLYVKYLLDKDIYNISDRLISYDDDYLYYNIGSFFLDGYEKKDVSFILFVDDGVDDDINLKYLSYNMYIY